MQPNSEIFESGRHIIFPGHAVLLREMNFFCFDICKNLFVP